MTRTETLMKRWAQAVGACLVVIALLVGICVALWKAYEAEHGIQGTCQVWHDLAVLPLSPAGSGTAAQAVTGPQLVADGRVQFDHLNCATTFGPLPPVSDPRVQAALKKLGH